MTPIVFSALVALATAAPPPTEKIDHWVPATAHAIPKETAPEGEGYFSIIEGHNGKLYIGTHANGVNAWLVEFDPKTKEMKVVVDCHKAIGKDLKGFGSQAKIHTRNNVGASGKIYFGTKQGYPDKSEKREDYPGGYPMVYDPKTGETKVYDIPVKYHGINSIIPDESRGVAYISTCSDGRPGPGESSIFLVLDLKTGKYRELIDTKHIYGFIVLDHLGRAYHPLLGGGIARYDPKTDKLDTLKQTIDGKEPKIDPNLVEQPRGHPINWDTSPDGKTLYCVPMSSNHLYAYDLTASGDTLPGRDLGALVPGAKGTDCRAMCVGPKGDVWVSVTRSSVWGINLHHAVSYTPGDKAPKDHGSVAIKNPDYTAFVGKDGKPLPYHAGTFKTPEGVTTSRHVTLGVCQTKAGSVYVLMLGPYTVLEIAPDAVSTANKSESKDELFVAKPLTEKNSFTPGIEGPACDAAGNLFVVNLKKNGDIARVTPDGKTEVFVELPNKSVGNGIVFDKNGSMFVADYTEHNILKIDPKTKKIEVFAHEPTMNQPNDLAIAPDGTLYASDPNWGKSTGQLWKISTDGKVTKVASDMGTTNGIEVSPDGKWLYVNESAQRNVWAFPIKADGNLGEKKLLKKFDDHGFDGMRCDTAGNLYITRYGAGTVVKLSPEGKILKEIDVLGKKPSNICFGGPDGRTAYVTEVEFNRVVQFRVDTPGLAWERAQKLEPGTIELFNGKDLTGWGYKSGDKFESFDGKTEASDKRYTAKDGVLIVNPGKGLQQLWTSAKFPKDFELRLEFRAAVNADSGLFVRGPQLQVRDYFVAGPYKDLKKYKPQDWNEIVVIVKGEVAYCTCNGEVLEAKFKLPATGPIGLEADRGQMEYRKIRLKELK